jgi:uncharacterized protein with HEPN domain
MPSRDWRFRVQDILESISRIETYTAGMTYPSFRENQLVIDAVVRNLEIIGEAASRVPAEVQQRNPELPWAEMRGIRNVLIHEYFGVSVEIVWKTVRENLPQVVAGLEELLRQDPG